MFSNHLASKADEELMHLMQKGDERALSELYDRYSKKLVRYFHRMLWKDNAKAQDFLHDLFVKIIERPRKFDVEKKFSTWMYSVAFNMCKNEYRKQNFRQVSQQSMNGSMRWETLQPEVDHKDFQKLLGEVLCDADEKDRNLFVLRYELDMPLSEIATITECPEGTVKSRLFYLKRKLAKQLQVYNPALK